MPVYPWQRVYKAAVLERDPAKLEEFVQSAFTVIYEHLRARGDITAEESEALSDALHALERLQKSKPGQSRRASEHKGVAASRCSIFRTKHSSQQLFVRFYDKRIRPAAGVLDNKGSSLRSDPQESGSACSPQLWVVMLKQLFPMYWVESAGGLL